eukprot:gene9789-2114_t
MFEEVKDSQYSFHKIYDAHLTNQILNEHLSDTKVSEISSFLQQVDEFKRLKSSINKINKAEEIITLFIKENSEKEINISVKVRKDIISNLDTSLKKDNSVSDDLFKSAESVMLDDLRFDIFPRFIKIAKFQKFMKNEYHLLGEEEFSKKYLKSNEELEQELNMNAYRKFERKSNSFCKIQETVKITNFLYDIEDKDFESIFPNLKKGNELKFFLHELLSEMSNPINGVVSVQKKNSILGKKKRKEFLGEEAIEWVKIHINNEDEPPIVDFFNLLMKKKLISPSTSKIKQFLLKETYFFNFKKRVVIVGSGYSGMFSAKILRDDFDVTVIDKKSSVEYNMSFYKLLTSPQLLSKYECPMTKVVERCKFIQSTVDHISAFGVYLEQEVVTYDYLIVATGCSYSVPFEIVEHQSNILNRDDRIFNQIKRKKQASIVTPYSSKSILSAHYDITHSKTIVIVGGGPVGVECAGELAMNLSNTKITLITNSHVLLERSPPSVQKAAYKILNSYKNVEICFNRYVSKVDGDKVYYKYKTKNSSIDETFIVTEAIIVCVGFRPNTSLLRSYMSDSLSDRGYVIVNDYFQVKFNQNQLSTRELVKTTKKQLDEDRNEMINKMEEEKSTENSSYSSNDLLTVPMDDTDDEIEDIKDIDEMLMKSLEVNSIESPLSPLMSPMNQSMSKKNSMRLSTLDFMIEKDSYMNIFAVGDILANDEEKVCFYSHAHGEIVANNIIHLENSSSAQGFRKRVKPYISNPNWISILAVGNQGIMIKGKSMIQRGKLALVAKNSLEKIFMTTYIPN